MFKKIFLFLSLIGVILAFSGCNVNVGGTGVRGSGDVVTRSIDVIGFSAIDISRNFVVVYRQSSEEALTVEMHENFFDYLEVEVRGNTLHIGSSRDFNTTNAHRPRLYVYAPYLTAADFSGAVNATDWDTIEGQSFFLDVSGAANVNIGLNVEYLDIDASGAANITLWGAANDINVDGSGALRISANDLQIQGGRINISGAALVNLSTLDNVSVSTSGAARVTSAD